MLPKVVYILPFYDEETDTHLFYNYELIHEVKRRGMDILALDAKALGFFKLFLKLIWLRFRGYKNCYVHYSFKGALFAIFCGYRVFYWNRGMPWLFKRSFLEEQIFRFILRHTILITGPESLAKEYQKRYGVKEYKILSNWIDIERFRPKDDKKAEPRIVLFVHHLSARKGADLVPKIAEGFKGEKVEFSVIGNTPNRDLPPHFQRAYIFLMPSREEGSPHVLLEAMAAGTPFVASDVGGVRELVPSGFEEFLCSSEGVKCFQEKVRKLLSDTKLYQRFRQAGLGFVRDFDISRGVREFLGLFEERLKLYYVANARMPTEKAHGIQLAKMCEAFVGAGADLELILPRKKNPITERIDEFYGLQQKIKIKKLPVLNWGFNFSAFSFAISYFFYLLFKKGIIYTIDLDYFSFFLVPFLGRPYFMEVHGEKKQSFAHSLIFSRIRGVFVINNFVKEALVRNFKLAPEKILVTPNGIDLRAFSAEITQERARADLGISQNSKIAVHTGQFYEWKGLGVISEAAKNLSGVDFFMVGGTKEEFQKVTGLEDLSPNLKFQGTVDFKLIPKWLSAADILLAPGTKKNEYSYLYTSPMKVFEYLAAGRPIVAARTPAICEVLSEKEAVFYEPDNAGDLAGKMRYILEHPNEAKFKVINASEKAKEFMWENRAKKISEFITRNI